MAIWAFYLDEYQGGLETVRGTWEAAIGERGTYTFSQEEALDELDLDFRAAYLDFVARNVLMDYADQRSIPDVDTVGRVDALPADGGEDGRRAPEGWGQNYVSIDDGLGEGDLVVTFTGDDDVEWAVLLVEHDTRDILRVAESTFEGGSGTVTLEGYGAHPVGLVVTPLDDSDSSQDYAYTIDLIVPEPDDTGDAAADDDGDRVYGGCGCASAPGRSSGLFGGLIALALLARRRGRA